MYPLGSVECIYREFEDFMHREVGTLRPVGRYSNSPWRESSTPGVWGLYNRWCCDCTTWV
jgi:hypothetical protein